MIVTLAGLQPRRALADLDRAQVEALHRAIVRTLREAIDGGGRDDEVDLFDYVTEICIPI